MTLAAQRARFVPVERGFNIKRSELAPRAFVAEASAAFAAGAPTGLQPLDLSAELGTDHPATTPFMLARYARIRAGETLTCRFAASGEIWTVLQGDGVLERAGEPALAWSEGDILALPGGTASRWQAQAESVLWMASDEPALAFLGVRPPAAARRPIETTHYTAAAIGRELEILFRRPMTPETAGRALFMASARTTALGTCLPALTLTLNAVRPGEAQRPHHHNAAALVLALREGHCASTIGGRKLAWTRHVTLLTPAGVPHAHRNEGEDGPAVTAEAIALALIVQDGGLHYYGRTMGFGFDDPA